MTQSDSHTYAAVIKTCCNFFSISVSLM